MQFATWQIEVQPTIGLQARDWNEVSISANALYQTSDFVYLRRVTVGGTYSQNTRPLTLFVCGVLQSAQLNPTNNLQLTPIGTYAATMTVSQVQGIYVDTNNPFITNEGQVQLPVDMVFRYRLGYNAGVPNAATDTWWIQLTIGYDLACKPEPKFRKII